MVSKEQAFQAMSRALLLADRARSTGDVPVGAVILDSSGRIIAQGWNQREALHDPCAHAEIQALRQAGNLLKRWNLADCTLVVTLEPCTMCAGAIISARIDMCVFGAWDQKAGAAGSLRDVLRDSRLNHQVKVWGGVLEDQAQAQLRAFFEPQRTATETPLDRQPVTRAVSQMGFRSTPRVWERSHQSPAASQVISASQSYSSMTAQADRLSGERLAGTSPRVSASRGTYAVKTLSEARSGRAADAVSPATEDAESVLRERVKSLPRVRVRQHHA